MRCRRLLRNLFLKSRRPSKCFDSPCSTFKAKNIWKKFLVGHPPNPPPTSMRGHQLMVRHNFAFELNNSKIFRCRTSKHSTSKFNFDASGLTHWVTARWRRRMTKKKKENSLEKSGHKNMAFLRKLFHRRLYSKGIFYWNHALQKSRVSRTYLMEWGLKLKAWCWTLVLNNFIIKGGFLQDDLSPGN